MIRTIVFASIFMAALLSLPAQAERFSQATAGDGKVVVTDSVTSLQWTLDEVADKTWQAALAYCEGLSYGGHGDWRLPNKNELAGLIHYGKYSPASDFPSASNNWLWSSSSYASYTNLAWYVDFSYGFVSFDNKLNSYSVRCVRP